MNNKGFAPIIIIGIIAGTFVAGTGTVVAANSSKPGDALYSIDRGTENVQVALALGSNMKEQVHKSIAEERLLEIEALLEEKELDASGIANALENFEEHKSKVEDMLDSDGIDEQEQEVKSKLEDKKSQIDKKFESQQKTLESQRETLKKQHEEALKSGDTARAADLKTQIDGFETLLKESEAGREAQKQETEKQEDVEKQKSEVEKKQEEEQSEAEKKAQEAAQHEAEQQQEENR